MHEIKYEITSPKITNTTKSRRDKTSIEIPDK